MWRLMVSVVPRQGIYNASGEYAGSELATPSTTVLAFDQHLELTAARQAITAAWSHLDVELVFVELCKGAR